MPCTLPSAIIDEVKVYGSAGSSGTAVPQGMSLGDPLADQALGPFLNPVEMAQYQSKLNGHRRRSCTQIMRIV